mmetsp:Transcript_49089/g.147823  ORF Transcript_49089/g.147823 Transcript_49089/m.147823 type:complete len:97 (+) Transcript_49089:438-728(+)
MTSLKHHYGLHCQIREWISMALIRRSFALVSKASLRAKQCGINMDHILSGVAESNGDEPGVDSTTGKGRGSVGRRMNYLLSTLLEPRSNKIIPVQD